MNYLTNESIIGTNKSVTDDIRLLLNHYNHLLNFHKYLEMLFQQNVVDLINKVQFSFFNIKLILIFNKIYQFITKLT